MHISRPRMFLYLNGIILLILCVHLGRWFFSRRETGHLVPPYSGNTIALQYGVGGKSYTGSYLRNEIPFSQREVEIRYLPWKPEVSRINSFLGILLEPLGWWAVFLLGSGVLLLMDNVVFSKGTVFFVQKRFPYLWMEEYFPATPEAGEEPRFERRRRPRAKRPPELDPPV